MRRNCPNLRRVFLSSIATIAVGGAASPLSAAVVGWTTWSSFSAGNPGTAAGAITTFPTPVNVGYSGQVLSASYTGVGPPPGLVPSWTPASTFSGGTVGNAPSNAGSIAVSGGATTGTNTITFSPAVTNPVMAIWSLGSPNTNPAEFDFLASEPFTIQAGGANTETGGSAIVIGAGPNIVSGVEGNGVIQFVGTYSSLTWTNPLFENDYTFTVGIEGTVPEPASMSLLALAAIGLLKRRAR